MNSVIRRSTSWFGFPRNDSWIADSANVELIPIVVVFAEALPGQFANTINSVRIHGSVLWSVHFRGVRTEYRDRARPKPFIYSQFFTVAQFIEQTVHVQSPSLVRIMFTDGG